MKNIFLITLCFLLCSVAPTYAQTQRVRIMEVDDINLGSWAMSSMTGNDPVCVYRNNGIPTYRIRATDNSTITPSNFYLQNTAATAQIRYSVTWGSTPAPGSTLLADGVVLSTAGANIVNSTCSGGDSANFKIDINNSDLAAVPAGTYTARVTLFAQP